MQYNLKYDKIIDIRGGVDMLVFVNKKNVEPHYTVLLAVKYAGWRTKVVFYDPINCLIKMEKMWQSSNNYSKRAFYILKESNEWIKSNKWIGFDWIINEINRRNIFNRHRFSSQSINIAQEKYNELVVDEWNQIESIENIEELKNIAVDFHDAHISKVEKFEDYQVIDFNTTWGCHILLKVYDIQEIELNYNLPNDYDIFEDSTIEVINDNLKFEFNAMFSDEQGNEPINKIICKKAFWKFVVSKCKRYEDED